VSLFLRDFSVSQNKLLCVLVLIVLLVAIRASLVAPQYSSTITASWRGEAVVRQTKR